MSTMAVQVITFVILLLAMTCEEVRGQNLNINLQSLMRDLNNPDLVEFQVACVANQGPCDERGRQLSLYIPVLFEGGRCFRCSREENRNLRVLVSILQRRYPRCWNAIIAVRQKSSGPKPQARGCTR
ncbi:uncharacterized protein LOC121877197 [Homarus americanus]|uniref:uncharacterized protein LOC121877197 n=1 Tax=Homarus americanus TaxID=6706 RepID=UPI001C48658A|nr:uncharacterized protein LOC121877197 [Homarus americanus]